MAPLSKPSEVAIIALLLDFPQEMGGHVTAWPSEGLPRPSPFEIDPGRVIAYFLSPSTSEFELVEAHLSTALEQACGRFGLSARLERAITSARPVIVHDEIWNALYNADLLVFDITGDNSSVMMELGVAAAWRLKAQVLVLQNKDQVKPLPFNLAPARVIRYELSPGGLIKLAKAASEAFAWSVSTLPISLATRYPRREVFPFRFPANAQDVVTPPLCHRHQRPDGSLEFGAPHAFQFSFAMPNTGPKSDVAIRAQLRFADRLPSSVPGSGWIGLKVLGSGVLMNHGVGAVVRPDGKVQVTYQKSERGPYRDPELKQKFKRFDPDRDSVQFDARVKGPTFSLKISSRKERIQHRLDLVRTARYRPTEGVCLLQCYRCRAVIEQLDVR
jgi:hypothetical protein